MKIEIGKEYYTRDDLDVYTILFQEDLLPEKVTNQTMLCGMCLRNGMRQWFTETGTWFLSGMSSELDLVRECKEL